VEINAGIVGVALAVGLLVGLTGVGAGAAMTPALVGFFGVPLPIAIATDLLFATITKAIGVLVHGRAGQVDWKLAKELWSGSIPAVAIGSLLLVGFVTAGHTTWLLWLLLAFVLFTSITLFFRGLRPQKSHAQNQAVSGGRWLAPLGGAGVGLGVSLTSVGAGVLGMALLVKLSPKDTPPQRLVATDLLHAIPIALVAGTSYALSGLVDFQLLLVLLIGSIPGVILGAFASRWIPARAMNIGLGIILATLAVLLIVS
jgi:uncharacterized membrane protein YfcA